MRSKQIQASFTAGEISPNAYGRSDIDLYYSACQEAGNFQIMPHGSARRRNGFQFCDSNSVALKQHELIPWRYDGNFMLVISNQSLKIYNSDGIDTGVAFSPPWVHTALNRLQWAQFQDTMVIVHPSYPPYVLTRNPALDTWSFAELEFINPPQISFPDGLASPTTTPEFTLTFSGTWASGDYFTLTTFPVFAGMPNTPDGQTEPIYYVDDDIALITRIGQAISLEIRNRYLGITNGVLISGTYPTYTIELIDEFGGYAIGKGEVVTAGSGDIAVVQTVAGEGTVLEDAFSAARGYPQTVAFYNQRLYFGGTPQLPQSLFGSVVGSFFDFLVGPDADDAIQVRIASDSMSIAWLASLQFLHIGTSHGDYVMDDSTAPVPTFVRHTSIRSAPIQPDIADSEILSVDDCRCRLSRMLYSEERQAWLSADVFVAADHMPQKSLRRVTHAQFRHPYVFCLKDDGTILAGAYDADNVAWAPWTLWDEVHAIMAMEDPTDGVEYLWAVVSGVGFDRNIVRCKLSTGFGHGVYLDDAVVISVGTPTSTITTAEHLDGVECTVIADGAVLNQTFVPSEGFIQLPDSFSEIVCGRRYTSRLVTMPLANALPGTSGDSPRRLAKATVQLYQSGACYLNGEEIRELADSADLVEGPPPLLTGRYSVPGGPYGEDGTIEIEIDDPLPLLVQAVYATAVSHGG